MTAAELIEELKKMPPEAQVWHLWDGGLHTEINHVWLARSGCVATADDAQLCYDGNQRSQGVPTSEEDRYWRTPDAVD